MIYDLRIILKSLFLNRKSLPFSRFTVHGNSMSPTLREGQNILCFNWAYVFFLPKEGDIVVVRKDGKDMVKRIEKILSQKYFIEGDNHNESTDSRIFGMVDKSEIIGKIVWYK